MRALLASLSLLVLGPQPASGQPAAVPAHAARNDVLQRALLALDVAPPTPSVLKAAQSAYLEAHGALAAYLQGKPTRRGAPSPLELRALLDPSAGTFVVVRGTLWLRPEHHERMARAARALKDERLAKAHENAAEASRP